MPARVIDSAGPHASERPAAPSAAPARPASENAGECSRAIIPGDDPGDQQLPKSTPLPSDSSPYVVGHWRLNDSFQDFTPGAPITTDNTDFVFLNPTNLTLTLEYAFFAPDGTFCGCDRDTLNPNGRSRYTMLGEQQGGMFSTTLCPAQTEGVLKSIVFTKVVDKSKIDVGDALQAGVQIHIFGSTQKRSESNLQGVTVNDATRQEMNQIHQQCVGFIGS